MSFASMSAEDISKIVKVCEPSSGFEKHILYCCGAQEFNLRKWLIKVLTRSGFRIIQDNYKVDRIKNDPRYGNVHNMLAIRGEAPDVCLVAHTDVCREHEEKRSHSSSMNEEFESYQKWLGNKKVSKEEFQKMKEEFIKQQESPSRVDPVIKVVKHNGIDRRIIQDRFCKTQVGGDDRLGVAIITWIALNTGLDMGLFFPTDEETGLKSSRACEMQELKDFELLVQVDRGNKSNELVTKINNEILCSFDMGVRLADIAYNMGKPRAPVVGANTDVYALKQRGMCKNAVNMTCGYHNSYGASADEYIDMPEATSTMHYVAKIVEDFYIFGR